MGEHLVPIATLGADLSSTGETRLLGLLEAILRATPSFHVEATYGEVAAAAALRHPWSMLLHTDGVIEGRRSPKSRDRFGIDGVLAHLRACREDRERLLDTLLQAAENANGGPLADDVALVLLSRGGEVGAAADSWVHGNGARSARQSKRPRHR